VPLSPLPSHDGQGGEIAQCHDEGLPTPHELEAALVEAATLDAASLVARHAVPFRNELSYAPGEAKNLDLIQNTALALGDPELARLESHGFAIGRGVEFPSFVYGYHSIYALDLPIYVSADAILFAMHRSYDDMLEALERRALGPELRGLLGALRASLSAAGLPAETAADLDLYLAVATSLLEDELAAPVAGADATQIASLVGMAKAASGGSVTIFGSQRSVDFSQFEPRGHYAGDPALERYFRAMMWLGRIDFRMTVPEGGVMALDRRQLTAAVGLHDVFDEATLAAHGRIDGAIRGFVGEADMMTVADVARFKSDLGIGTATDLSQLDDATLLATLHEGDYGLQRIASHVLKGAPPGELPRSLAFLPQRYVVDSYVFANVVYDRVEPKDGASVRYMPNPLDVAFAALENDHAAALLEGELDEFGYAPNLAATRALADAHGCDYWETSLYGQWLSALRALSRDVGDLPPGLPEVAQTEPWARRLTNTQLASWAELRHDTILYAKQSYSGGETCEFPDAYVDPYPAFYGAVRRYAERGQAIIALLAGADVTGQHSHLQHPMSYFEHLAQVATTLEAIALRQREGLPPTADQMAFVNEMVVAGGACGGPDVSGWYVKLFYDVNASVEFDPTIADVHTQPFDGMNEVGNVLHVATGYGRPMVVTVDGCDGPRAFVGIVSSYFELITSGYQRLDDQAWSERFETHDLPAVPAWLADLVGE
jgi:hypothetical protein